MDKLKVFLFVCFCLFYLLVLSIAKFSKRVSSFPSVPCEYIHIAINPKEQLPTIVIRGWFFKFQKIPKKIKNKNKNDLQM